jgi:phospholipid-translocating ATPase
MLLEFCEQLALEGLRTLVFAQKVLTEQEYQTFMTAYEQASSAMNNREKQITQSMKLIEKDMEFLGVSGVEDKL